MPEVINSPRFSFRGAFKTTVRHTVLPIVAGAAAAAIDTMQSGSISPGAMVTAAKIAGLAGVARWLHFFCTNQEVTK